MRRLVIATITLTVILGLSLYSILTTSPSTNPQLVFWLPINVGLIVALIYALIRLFLSREKTNRYSFIYLRQGLLLGIVLGVILYLQGLKVVSLLDTSLIILAAWLLEMFFQAEKTDLRTPS